MTISIKYFLIGVLCFVLAGMCGCATILRGTKEKVNVTSEPLGAKVSVNGKVVGKTPLYGLKLKRKEKHTITIEKEDHFPYEASIDQQLNKGWLWTSLLTNAVNFTYGVGAIVDWKMRAIYDFSPVSIKLEQDHYEIGKKAFQNQEWGLAIQHFEKVDDQTAETRNLIYSAQKKLEIGKEELALEQEKAKYEREQAAKGAAEAERNRLATEADKQRLAIEVEREKLVKEQAAKHAAEAEKRRLVAEAEKRRLEAEAEKKRLVKEQYKTDYQRGKQAFENHYMTNAIGYFSKIKEGSEYYPDALSKIEVAKKRMESARLELQSMGFSYNSLEDLFECIAYNETKDFILFLSSGANMNIKNRSNGNTPLHIASEEGKTEVVDILLKINVDIKVKNSDGKSPIDIAREMGHMEIVDLFTK
jgi:hypothetical protein